ncbi:MAG: hypothetical protein C4538_07485 [Nitrospiraceae bacterium]|nr:MAG: hypothetical protein C4538_07485 [Nitrospiraceae bacterium]
MINEIRIIEEVPGLYKLIPLNIFRRTPGVLFDNVPTKAFPNIGAIDRVVHVSRASSPGPVGDVKRPWYMHPHQEDNLIVLHGTRHVELYTRKHGKIENFEVSSEIIKKGGKVIYEGAAMLCWPTAVFHRVSSLEEGSVAINFAVHNKGIDIRTNFNIYDVNMETGAFRVIREGYLDQPIQDLEY